MAGHVGHAHRPEGHLPPIAWAVVLAVGAVVAASWIATWLSADQYMALLERQLAGAAPADTLSYLALSGVMMVAMMLPSALPMVRAYRALVAKDAPAVEARLRSVLFTGGYFVVWTAFTALALAALMALGLMGAVGGPAAFVPGALLVAAGVYQLTGWKRFCLRHCRSPLAFLMTHWRSGRAGAARMGLAHAAYCLGCCWLLMLVLFVAGAMSVLWMGVFALLVLAEKTWSRGEGFSRALGIAGIAVGALVLGLAWGAPAPAGEGMDPGMGAASYNDNEAPPPMQHVARAGDSGPLQKPEFSRNMLHGP
jgi:predicted metal-binding membrane protein